MVRHLRGSYFPIVLAGIVSVGCSSSSSSTQPGTATPANAEELTAAEKTEIADFIEEARKNFENGQHLLFSKKFTNDGKLTPPQAAAATGRLKIAKFVQKSPKITDLSISNLVVEGAGKNAVVTGTVAMAGLMNDPANNNALTVPVSVSCSLLITLKKNNNGEWRAKNVACPGLAP